MSLFTRFSRAGALAASKSRSYATAAVADAAGVKVAGVERGAPPGTVNLTVVVKAGSRYETTPGVAHALKNFAFKTTSKGSALKIARETELYGGVLSAGLSREHIFLTAEFLRGDEAHFLSLLASVLSSTQYYPHEYTELVLPTIETESRSALSTPAINALDVAHSLAFRRGLGNSLFAQQHNPVSAADVKAYATQAYAKSNIAVLGGGISTEALSSAVQQAFGSGSGGSSLSSGATQYFGGESRIAIDTHANPDARQTLTIAFGKTGDASADLRVLPHLVGGASSIKWGVGTSPLAVIAGKVPGAEIKADLLPYSDAALFTVTVSAPSAEGVKTLAKEVVAAVKEAGSAKEEDVKKAIAKAKVADASRFENTAGLLTVAAPGLFKGDIPSLDSTFASLDNVSASSFGKAASELFKAKPTVVAVGDLAVLPYADEIGL